MNLCCIAYVRCYVFRILDFSRMHVLQACLWPCGFVSSLFAVCSLMCLRRSIGFEFISVMVHFTWSELESVTINQTSSFWRTSTKKSCTHPQIQSHENNVHYVWCFGDHRRFCVLMYRTLFPRMNASPYLFFNWPPTYSSVCSSAMFM